MTFKFLNAENKQKASNYEDDSRSPSIVVAPQGGNHYTVNITQEFGDAYSFDNVIALLNNATEYDDITFNISSRGGHLFSLIAVQNALSTTQARFHMVLLGQACSAGGALFLTEGAASYQIGKHTMLMIHPVQCGTGYGAANENQTRANANSVINENFVRSCYQDFLTEDEINDVIKNNREIYMFDDEVSERLAKRIELRGVQLEEKMIEAEESLETDSFEDVPDEVLKAEREAITQELRKRSKLAKKASV